MRRNAVPALVLVMLCCVVAAQTAKPSLVEMAREHGSVDQYVLGCGVTPSLADVVGRAEIAVRGVVVGRSSHLTADAFGVFTDFDLAIHEVFFQTHAITTDRPGLTPSMVFRTDGGQVTVEGLSISVAVELNGSRVNLNIGDDAYIFARFDRETATWGFGPLDVFPVADGRVTGGTTETLEGVGDGGFREMLTKPR
jgi:hypothetical protein